MKPNAFDVSCPVCHASLTISPEALAVVGHREPKPPSPVATMEEAVDLLRHDPDRRDSLFQRSVESEKQKADRLKKSFDDLLRRTNETPDTGRPLRPMDLD